MNEPKKSIADRRRAFHDLHKAGCFVIPNPWDPGTARYLQSLGFKALATTSSGFAWSRACPDNGITRDAALAHLRDMVAATEEILTDNGVRAQGSADTLAIWNAKAPAK